MIIFIYLISLYIIVANGSVKETVKDEEFEPYLQQAPHQVSDWSTLKQNEVYVYFCLLHHLFSKMLKG